MTATARAALDWFGYGSWTAPYWFVGMEPGGEGDGASHESWARLGGDELIDCRAHHLDCGFTRWHGAERPPTQPTWRRLTQLLLAYKGEDTGLDAVAHYQRDRLGAAGDETAIIELSAIHAVNLDVAVDRAVHRAERIARIRQRLDEHEPHFVVFYGLGYRSDYEGVVGVPFGLDGAVWRDRTLCVVTPHPVAQSGPKPEFWVALGEAMQSAVDAGPGSRLSVADGQIKHSITRPRATTPPPDPIDVSEVPIVRAEGEVGRIIREGKNVRVESREADGSYRVLGFYERSELSTFPRKVREIDDIFDAWRNARVGDGSEVKVSWRKREFVPAFREQPGAMTHGCSVVEDDGVPIAYVYKIAPTSAVWVSA